jgi:hypothetical protein
MADPESLGGVHTDRMPKFTRPQEENEPFMRPLIVLTACLCCFACSKPNQNKQQPPRSDTTTRQLSRQDSTSKPVVQKPEMFRRKRIFELGKLADLHLVAIQDTILAEHLEYDLAGPHSTGAFIPLLRSFGLYGFEIEATTKDSVLVIIEELKALRKGGQAEKTEGDLFIVRHGVVVVADMDDPNVERDSTLSIGIDRQVFTQALPSSNSLLVIGEDSSPCYGACETFKAYGVRPDGKLTEFPGLYIRQVTELPKILYNRQMFETISSHGCIIYEIPMCFDSVLCEFITLVPDSGYTASCNVKEYVFRRYGNSIHIPVRRTPSVNSTQEDAVLNKTDSTYVTRLFLRNNEHWALLSKNGRILGWIDQAAIALLQLNACD